MDKDLLKSGEVLLYSDDNNKEIHFETLQEAEQAIEILKNNTTIVDSINIERKNRASKPIYTTSTMQQDASSKLNFNAKKTKTQHCSLSPQRGYL
mgnify:CR=1 FL=1